MEKTTFGNAAILTLKEPYDKLSEDIKGAKQILIDNLDASGFLRRQAESAYIEYGANCEICMGASAGINLATSGTIDLNANGASAGIKLETSGAINLNAVDGVTVPEPTQSEHAVNKGYVDNRFANSGFIGFDDLPDIPKKTSELENDAGFITASDVPDAPSKFSQLKNDVGFIAPNDAGEVYISGSTVTIEGGSVTVGETSYGFSVTNNRVQNVGAPQEDADAATKGYVDSSIENIKTPTKLSQFENDAGYIAPNDSNQLTISASTVTISGGSVAIGDTTYGFSVSNNKIENVGTPEANTDAATKGYVDGYVNERAAYDTVINSAEEWQAMISDSTWKGAKKILINVNIIRIAENTLINVPKNVTFIDGNFCYFYVTTAGASVTLNGHNDLYIKKITMSPFSSTDTEVYDTSVITNCYYVEDCTANRISSCSNVHNCSALYFDSNKNMVFCAIRTATDKNGEVIGSVTDCAHVVADKAYVDSALGDVDSALDGIIDIQNSLMEDDAS